MNSFFSKLLLHWQWTIAGVTVLVVVGGVFFLWMPEYNRMEQFDPLILQAKDQERQLLAQTAEELQKIQKNFDALDPVKKARIEAVLPRSVSFTQLLMTLSRLAASVGFSVESFSLQEPIARGEKGKREDGEIVQLQVRVAGQGYTQWKNFLWALERQLPLMDFVSTQYKPETQVQEFSLVTYILP